MIAFPHLFDKDSQKRNKAVDFEDLDKISSNQDNQDEIYNDGISSSQNDSNPDEIDPSIKPKIEDQNEPQKEEENSH